MSNLSEDATKEFMESGVGKKLKKLFNDIMQQEFKKKGSEAIDPIVDKLIKTMFENAVDKIEAPFCMMSVETNSLEKQYIRGIVQANWEIISEKEFFETSKTMEDRSEEMKNNG